ncbi:3-demethoxyubiquinol 3-hydroxylase [Azospirillaceae bacterium]
MSQQEASFDFTTVGNNNTRPQKTAENTLPGDLNAQQLLERIIRVDHAGEYGAKRIYEGQLAVLGKSACAPMIRHMANQEQAHLEEFERQIIKRRVRPTLLHPFWHVAGFALGAATALMGEKTAMACTVAVEQVIDEHYGKQAEKLGEDEAELRRKIEEFRADEVEHRDAGLAHNAEQAPGYEAISALIKLGTKAAIWFSERA